MTNNTIPEITKILTLQSMALKNQHTLVENILKISIDNVENFFRNVQEIFGLKSFFRILVGEKDQNKMKAFRVVKAKEELEINYGKIIGRVAFNP